MLQNGCVNHVDFGADPTGVADSAAAFTAAIAHCYANKKTLVGDGTYKFLSPVNFRYICVQMPNASFNVAHAGIGVFVGGSAGSGNEPPQHIGTVTRSVGADGYYTPTVRCIGAKGQHITLEFTTYFQIWADTNPDVAATDYSTAYSTFVLKHATTVELTSNPNSTGSSVQWINENFFYLNRTERLYVSGTYAHNHNYFEGGTFESDTAAIINFQIGLQNYVRNIRQEGVLNVTFAAGVQDCIVTIGWSSSSHRYPSFGVNVVNNGSMCAVQHNFDLYAPITTLVGFSYQTLKKVSSDYSIQGVSNITVGASNLSVGGFTTMYTSPLIAINGENNIFELNLYNLTAGGLRVKVDGYNSAKSLITPAANQVTYDGVGNRQFGQLDNASNTIPSARFFILDPNCKFIVITVQTGGAGATFDAFYLGMRAADIELRKKTLAYGYATNNFV